MSREQPVDASDDWTLHMAIGLDLGRGRDDHRLQRRSPAPTGRCSSPPCAATYDLKHGFAGMLTLRQWWLPGPNHALMIGFGTRFEPFVYNWGRIFFDAALGPVSTANAWTFGYDLGAGIEFDLPDVPGFSIGPYFRYGQVINPDKTRQATTGLAWSAGASFTYHFGRAAAAPKTSSDHRRSSAAPGTSASPTPTSDGVPDDEDQCKSTPAGAHPDPFRPGCPEGDEDGDGVPDVDDACPVTPPGPKPDPKRPGCPFLDTDGDGDLRRRRRLPDQGRARPRPIRPRTAAPTAKQGGAGRAPAVGRGQGAQAGEEEAPRPQAEDRHRRRANQLANAGPSKGSRAPPTRFDLVRDPRWGARPATRSNRS